MDTIKGWLYDDEPDNVKTSDNDDEGYEKDYQSGIPKEGFDAFVVISRPKDFMDTEKICDNIKNGIAVVIDTKDMSFENKRRMIDFLSGVVMAKDGVIARIYENVYICSPKNIGVIEQ